MHFLVFARAPDHRKVEKQPKIIFPDFAGSWQLKFCQQMAKWGLK
jgi:hypothetical protein